ncbi:MAG: RAMP superfamily CRISPR-associated protein [Candidatus Vecturithrix sp.]|jgi:CRISPR/Cas system CSM-associated protein Csm3 (group 7 of RAMP superfamily)|nr:RAMP superfamily CRISPR-associated protein [Candidatus Vecturithrix sp.]
MQNKPIIGKIIVQGEVECLSPLHIGNGKDERSDLDVLLDAQGNPFIPATSLVGVLRHATKNIAPQEDWKKFWGYTSEKQDEQEPGQQSSMHCSDLICQSQTLKPVIRDGIEIDNITGIVKKQRKYDYELVERGTRFKLNMEFSYKEADKEFVRRMAATIYTLLNDKQIRLGAKTNSGFGEICLLENTTKIYEFQFSPTTKSDVLYWLTRNFSAKQPIAVNVLGTPFEITSNHFNINASFWLKNSLIVRSYSADPDAPDATHITSNNDWILPGSSLKGAIRARAERIVNTLNKPKELVENLFGFVVENEKENNKKKGRIRVKEAVLPQFVSEMQTRIKIDRFTGGTIESALFETMPLFGGKPDKIINLQLHVRDCQPYEAGLLLLVLKDLWTGDLAVGGEKNVGRGVFQGIQAEISWKDQTWTIPEHVQDMPEEQKKALNEYVRALMEYKMTTAD